MGFIERLGRGWHIVLQSFRVIQADKELLVYPILQGLIILALGVFVFASAFLGSSPAINDVSPAPSGFLLFFFLFIILTYFISVFFQATIVASASIRFGGKNPALKDGFVQPIKRIFALFTWALVSFVVAMVLNALRSERSSGIGSIGRNAVAGTAELTWSLITFYTIPVLLFEKLNVFKAIGRSSSLFKKTWGEHVTARFAVGALVGIITIPFLLIFFWALSSQNITFMIISAILLFVAILVVCVLRSVTDGILRAALYRYAISGKVPSVFAKDSLKSLFG